MRISWRCSRYEQGGPEPEYDFCTPFFRSLENDHQVFSEVFAYVGNTLQVRGGSANENVPGALVSGEFFQALETPPLLGRSLTPLDDQPGGNPAGLAVVISESFWNNWFNRAPDVLGRKLIIANTPFTVVGVMPKRLLSAPIPRSGRRSMRRCPPTQSSTHPTTISPMAFTPGG